MQVCFFYLCSQRPWQVHRSLLQQDKGSLLEFSLRRAVHIRFVQATLCKRDGTKKSVDCVAFLGGNGRAGGERCWLELRWTRDLLDSGALSVQGAWSVVDGYGQILNELSEWKLDKRLGCGRVFRPLRLGVLLVNRTSYRLELAGAPTHVFCGALTEARRTGVQNSSVGASVMASSSSSHAANSCIMSPVVYLPST